MSDILNWISNINEYFGIGNNTYSFYYNSFGNITNSLSNTKDLTISFKVPW